MNIVSFLSSHPLQSSSAASLLTWPRDATSSLLRSLTRSLLPMLFPAVKQGVSVVRCLPGANLYSPSKVARTPLYLPLGSELFNPTSLLKNGEPLVALKNSQKGTALRSPTSSTTTSSTVWAVMQGRMREDDFYCSFEERCPHPTNGRALGTHYRGT